MSLPPTSSSTSCSASSRLNEPPLCFPATTTTPPTAGLLLRRSVSHRGRLLSTTSGDWDRRTDGLTDRLTGRRTDRRTDWRRDRLSGPRSGSRSGECRLARWAARGLDRFLWTRGLIAASRALQPEVSRMSAQRQGFKIEFISVEDDLNTTLLNQRINAEILFTSFQIRPFCTQSR